MESCGCCCSVFIVCQTIEEAVGEQRAGGRRVVTMGPVQEWRRQGRVQVAATQLLINSCESPVGEALYFSLEEKSLRTVHNVFFEVINRLKVASLCAGPCSPKVCH